MPSHSLLLLQSNLEFNNEKKKYNFEFYFPFMFFLFSTFIFSSFLILFFVCFKIIERKITIKKEIN